MLIRSPITPSKMQNGTAENSIIRNDREKFDKAQPIGKISCGREAVHRLLCIFIAERLPDKFEIFENWLTNNGTKVRKLELKVFMKSQSFLILRFMSLLISRTMAMKSEVVMQKMK